MIGKMTQIEGPALIRHGHITGDFHNWPKEGDKICMFAPDEDNEGEMRFIETTFIDRVLSRNGGDVTFTCIDGSKFNLKMLQSEGSVMMVGGLN